MNPTKARIWYHYNSFTSLSVTNDIITICSVLLVGNFLRLSRSPNQQWQVQLIERWSILRDTLDAGCLRLIFPTTEFTWKVESYKSDSAYPQTTNSTWQAENNNSKPFSLLEKQKQSRFLCSRKPCSAQTKWIYSNRTWQPLRKRISWRTQSGQKHNWVHSSAVMMVERHGQACLILCWFC